MIGILIYTRRLLYYKDYFFVLVTNVNFHNFVLVTKANSHIISTLGGKESIDNWWMKGSKLTVLRFICIYVGFSKITEKDKIASTTNLLIVTLKDNFFF